MKIGDLVKLKDVDDAVHPNALTSMRSYRRLALELKGKTAIVIGNTTQSVIIMYENKQHVVYKEYLKLV